MLEIYGSNLTPLTRDTPKVINLIYFSYRKQQI